LAGKVFSGEMCSRCFTEFGDEINVLQQMKYVRMLVGNGDVKPEDADQTFYDKCKEKYDHILEMQASGEWNPPGKPAYRKKKAKPDPTLENDPKPETWAGSEVPDDDIPF
jgi:hypothetical protein